MSADDFRQLFHLTPNGWLEGLTASYAKIDPTQAEKNRPADALETWEEHLTQSSIYSETHSSKQLVWRSPDHSQEECERIAAQFKDPFHGHAPRPLDAFRQRRAGVPKPQPRDPSLFDED